MKTSISTAERDAVERWFLQRGLPAVLKPGALLHRVWSRSAPALAALATFATNTILVAMLAGDRAVDIAGTPTATEWLVLALLTVVTPAAVLMGWLVSRIAGVQRRLLVANASLALIALGAFFGGVSTRQHFNLVFAAVCLAIILAATATGLGSILGWSARMTLANLAQSMRLLGRALPVVLLTFLVFFNGNVWLMSAVISRERLWLGTGLLYLIAAAYLVSGTQQRVLSVLSSPKPTSAVDAKLAGTPLENVSGTTTNEKLSTAERVNVVFVVAASQLAFVFVVAAITGMIFFVLGLILISPDLLGMWTQHLGSTDGRLLNMTIPVPDPLIQISMMLTAITFMYLAAKAATELDFRARFLDPMLEDLEVTLLARARCRSRSWIAGQRD